MSENDAREKLLREATFGAKLALANWQKYNSNPADEIVYQAEKVACALRDLLRATSHPEPTADAPGEARQRLLALAECRDLSVVYGSEWCFDRAEQFSADIRAALRPQSPDAVALLRKARPWIERWDSGSVPDTLCDEIDQFLQSEDA